MQDKKKTLTLLLYQNDDSLIQANRFRRHNLLTIIARKNIQMWICLKCQATDARQNNLLHLPVGFIFTNALQQNMQPQTIHI